MHDIKDHIPIIFNGGSYGSFLQYCLVNISSITDNVQDPFTENGASHKLITNVMCHDNEGKLTLEKKSSHKFIKYHPKLFKHDSLPDTINRISKITNKSILIYPSQNDKLLVMNNIFCKVWKDDWLNNELLSDSFERKIFLDNLYLNWDIKYNTPLDKIPKWIQREFLSYYYFIAWESLYEWDMLESYIPDKSLHIVNVNDILYNFEKTIKILANFCDIEIRNLTQIMAIHEKMLTLQQHINKDKVCHDYIEHFTKNKHYTMPEELSLLDEAWIQNKLREKGVEIQCSGLNQFPTTVYDLKKITYNIIN